jgi:tol-pal system protein YbgF
MKPIITMLAAVVIAVSLAPATPAAQNREHQQMTADVRMLQEQSQLLAQSIAQTLARLGELGESMKKIEARLDATEAANRKLVADQKLSLDSLSTDLRIVREGTQNVNMRIGMLSEEIEALRTSLPSLAAQAAPPADPVSDALPGGVVPVAAAPAAAAPAARSGLSSNRLFQTAMADYTSGNYSLAITGFQALLEAWPKSEQADDAMYYIGQSHLSQKKYDEAIKAFDGVIQKYPTGDKVPEAYVDLGQAYRAAGQLEAARAAWLTVIAGFPTTSSAIIARQRLDGLPETAPPKP